MTNDLHPAAEALAKAESGYLKIRAKAATAKANRDGARVVRDQAIIAACEENPDQSVAGLAARFGISESTVRYIANRGMVAPS